MASARFLALAAFAMMTWSVATSQTADCGNSCPPGSGATCQLFSGVPVCKCPSGQALVGPKCTSSGGQTFTTSIAAYNKTNYGGSPMVFRVAYAAIAGGCVNIPTSSTPILSYKIVKDVNETSSNKYTCSVVYFWSKKYCGQTFGTAALGNVTLLNSAVVSVADSTGLFSASSSGY